MESQQPTPNPAAKEASAETAGRYHIQEELGRGAAGTVFKAYDRVIGRTVALKAISIERNMPNRDEAIERLKQEAKAAGKLDHPNIITIYDVGQENDVIYLSMQFIEGKTLLAFLAESGVPPLPQLIAWADQILSAVGFAHRHGVIHRDLKPANLMLTAQGTIKVLDFGVAKVGNDALTQTGLVIGTPSYMAPEQVAGKKIDHRADIFALGAVFYELATREKAFRGDVTTVLYKIMNDDPVPPSLVNPALPGGIDGIIRKALAKDPKDRFESCEQMRTAFLEQAALLKIKPTSSLPAGAAESAVARERQPVPIPRFLLQQIPERRRTSTGRKVAMALCIAVIAAAIWTLHKRLQMTALSPVVNKVESAAQNSWNKGKAKLSQAPRTIPFSQHGSVIAEPDRSGSNSAGTVANSGNTTTAAPSDAGKVETQSATDASSNVPPQQAAAAGVSGAQSSGENAATAAPAVTTSAPAMQDTTAAATPNGPSPAGSPAEAVQQNQDTDAGEKNPGSENSQTVEQTGNNAATNSDIPQSQNAEASSASPSSTPTSATSEPAKDPMQPALVVSQPSREDIPELLRRADAAEERGEYAKARQNYELVLKLDPSNGPARAGLYRIKAMEQPH
jgi:serine/threonine-protein kinase